MKASKEATVASEPLAAMAASTLVRRVLRPNHTGVPTAPKVTGIELRIRLTHTAARAGKPRPRSRGAQMAAGVPKPAEPSIKAPNKKAMMMVWTRRSGEMVVNP